MVEGFVGEQGEGVGFFGLFGDPEFLGGEEFDWCEGRFELTHEKRIAGAAAGDNKLGDFRVGEDKAVERVYHAEGGEDGRGADEVFGTGAEFATFAENFFDESAPKIFTAGRLRGLKAEVRIGKEFFQERNQAIAARGDACAGIEAVTALAEVSDEGVDEDVGGAGVEGRDVGRFGMGGDYGNVGDAAEVEGDAADFFVAVEEVVGEGD